MIIQQQSIRPLVQGLLFATLLACTSQLGACAHSQVVQSPSESSTLIPAEASVVEASPAPSYWVSFAELSEISQLDPLTGEIFNTFNIYPSVGSVITDPKRPLVYALSSSPSAIVFISTGRQQVETVLDLPESINSWTLSANTGQLFLAGVQTVYVVSTVSRELTETIDMASSIGGVAASLRNHKVFATLPQENSIAVIDTPSARLEKKKIFAGPCPFAGHASRCHPYAIAASSDGQYVVAFANGPRVTIGIDARSNAIIVRNTYRCLFSPGGVVGTNPVSDEAWIFCGGYQPLVPIALQPPFGMVQFSDQIYGKFAFGQAAFDPSGSGYVIGKCFPRCTSAHLFSISPTNVVADVARLPSDAFGITYVP